MDLELKVTKGVRSAFISNSYPKGKEVGESHVFAHGFTNMLVNQPQPVKFRYVIEYKDARDSFSNPIDVDEEVILEWFELNDFPEPSLELYGYSYIPLGLTIGEKVTKTYGTQKGTYYFELVVEYEKTKNNWEEYIVNDFSMRVI